MPVTYYCGTNEQGEGGGHLQATLVSPGPLVLSLPSCMQSLGAGGLKL